MCAARRVGLRRDHLAGATKALAEKGEVGYDVSRND
jgi:hypothetical protein